MRTAIEIVIVAALLAWAHAQYHAGAHDGYQKSARFYERVIAERSNLAIEGYRRVQAIREQSEYERGKRTCEK